MSTLEYIKEEARQKKTKDYNFVRRFLYFFELVIPAKASVSGNEYNFLFPLIIPPESYSMSEPFTVETTPTNDGGLYVEEDGIVARNIVIRGNTGFRPRILKTFNGDSGAGDSLKEKLGARVQGAVNSAVGGIIDLGSSVAVPAKLDSTRKSFGRILPEKALSALSGHRHFQYLQDSVFRTYADLKADKTFAQDTVLIFHNPKDDEHWRVIPLKFTLDRDKGRPLLYNYNIELLAVEPAEARNADFSEDKGLLDQFKDGLRIVNNGLGLVKGAFDDLVALQGELRSIIGNITTIIDSVARIIESCQEFVDGNTRLIDSTHSWHVSRIELIEEVLESVREEEDKGSTNKLPVIVENKMRLLVDGLELIGSNPALFSLSNRDSLIDSKNIQIKTTSLSRDRITKALNQNPISTFENLENLGTGLTPGEALALEGELQIGNEITSFSNSREVVVQEGDTLASLSAQYIGDARYWQYIAVLNGLNPPFVDDLTSINIDKLGDEYPFTKALGIGDKILIPSNTASTLDYPLLPVQGSAINASINDQLLGVDALLSPESGEYSSNTLYDIPIDTEHGSTDIKYAHGITNFTQSIINRVVLERGTDILYKSVGLKRVIGLGFILGDLENAKYRLRESILSDNRVGSIKSLEVNQENDILIINTTLIVRGFSEAKNVSVIIR